MSSRFFEPSLRRPHGPAAPEGGSRLLCRARALGMDERIELRLAESRLSARVEVEWAFQLGRLELAHEPQVGRVWIGTALRAQMPVPVIADRHMSDLVT